MTATVEIFASAAYAFARLVRAIPADSFDGPGLGEWDLRALVGHTSRSLITVSTYLQNPASTADLAGPVEYYAAMRGFMSDAGADAIVERGRQAGHDLGSDPTAAVDALVSQALADVDEAGDPLITVIGGFGIQLSGYLPTRIFELAVHSLDIARATGLSADLPAEVLETANVLATQIAVALGEGETLLLALTGRAELPRVFSVT
ncbi:MULTISPECIES: maleylpyruvate isomerase family mycothiol-dependent enzyme [unclassified Mycolicibacterium]|uniref:maleylpyruvate isomerase family mycothiol-dependent enzyme n=1 Tax=unclassified Mycolicibacterium TaxID=2636767 RepID=UPI0013096005|nr:MULTISPECIES: maleylpyruvate isomerase family mycothiol-dependent enzyme [unclassified Mycolicibacterium]MUL85841.1 maleylpyruvate isomerase family mycothiol-dependent enzyme [Mycolicibacterium sp. CBMA 329]MUL90211.1 maleylpyruvate isomerase family mycothiol-dependent enzyme [Mycolicibacterium sp. CBMA 331]MUM00980.1 maleylpyruvate isomerase family mycothiol-dependent enzyme [Mycolicibacterium sp. CBMA 334]MUM27146.1 maleylpyruvate isomerase family mycothiol-dependent enzyme [Mycolicibacter